MRYLGLILAAFLAMPAAAIDDNPEVNKAFAKLLSALPSEGQLTNIPYIQRYGRYGSGIRTRLVDSDVVPGDRALRVKVKRRTKNPWDVGITMPILGQLKKGDVLLAAVWMRCAVEICSFISTGLQQHAAPYRDIVRRDFMPTNDWTVFYLKGVTTSNFDTQESQLAFQLGGLKQVVEFGPAFVINMGPKVALSDLPGN